MSFPWPGGRPPQPTFSSQLPSQAARKAHPRPEDLRLPFSRASQPATTGHAAGLVHHQRAPYHDRNQARGAPSTIAIQTPSLTAVYPSQPVGTRSVSPPPLLTTPNSQPDGGFAQYVETDGTKRVRVEGEMHDTDRDLAGELAICKAKVHSLTQQVNDLKRQLVSVKAGLPVDELEKSLKDREDELALKEREYELKREQLGRLQSDLELSANQKQADCPNIGGRRNLRHELFMRCIRSDLVGLFCGNDSKATIGDNSASSAVSGIMTPSPLASKPKTTNYSVHVASPLSMRKTEDIGRTDVQDGNSRRLVGALMQSLDMLNDEKGGDSFVSTLDSFYKQSVNNETKQSVLRILETAVQSFKVVLHALLHQGPGNIVHWVENYLDPMKDCIVDTLLIGLARRVVRRASILDEDMYAALCPLVAVQGPLHKKLVTTRINETREAVLLLMTDLLSHGPRHLFFKDKTTWLGLAPPFTEQGWMNVRGLIALAATHGKEARKFLVSNKISSALVNRLYAADRSGEPDHDALVLLSTLWSTCAEYGYAPDEEQCRHLIASLVTLKHAPDCGGSLASPQCETILRSLDL